MSSDHYFIVTRQDPYCEPPYMQIFNGYESIAHENRGEAQWVPFDGKAGEYMENRMMAECVIEELVTHGGYRSDLFTIRVVYPVTTWQICG